MHMVETGDLLPQLWHGSWCVPTPANTQVIKDDGCRVRAIERVKMNPCHIIFNKIVTLLQCVLDADMPDHFGIVLASLQRTEQLRGKPCAASQRGHAFESTYGGDRHDAGDNRNVNTCQGTTLPEIDEIPV